MNIKHVFYTVLALGLMTATPAVVAQNTIKAPTMKAAKNKADAKDKEEAEPKPAESEVGKALEGMTFLTDKKPNTHAKYYIFLQSASWCGPCNAEMPHVVKQYKAMGQGKKKVEIILLSHDKSNDAAVGFMKKYNADFPCVLASSVPNGTLPGYKYANAIPNASVVKEDGKEVVNTVAPEVIKNWKKYTKK